MNELVTNNNTDLIEAGKQTPAELKNDKPDTVDAEFSETKFFPVSEGKLITLYILSFRFIWCLLVLQKLEVTTTLDG